MCPVCVHTQQVMESAGHGLWPRVEGLAEGLHVMRQPDPSQVRYLLACGFSLQQQASFLTCTLPPALPAPIFLIRHVCAPGNASSSVCFVPRFSDPSCFFTFGTEVESDLELYIGQLIKPEKNC